MPNAATRIVHDGTIYEPGDDISDIPEEAMEDLRAVGSVDDSVPAPRMNAETARVADEDIVSNDDTDDEDIVSNGNGNGNGNDAEDDDDDEL